MEENNSFSNHNGVDSNHNGVDHHDEESEEKDHVPPLEDEEVGAKTASFKNWYRRASANVALSSSDMKHLEEIPIVYEDGVDEAPAHPPKPVNDGDTAKDGAQSKEEQEILDAISRRLSIKSNSITSSSPNEPTPSKLKPTARRGSVPQARLLKGNVKNRMAAFEKK